YKVAFLIVLVFFSAEMKIGNGFEIPVIPEPTGKWCGYSVPMKPYAQTMNALNNVHCGKYAWLADDYWQVHIYPKLKRLLLYPSVS
ncbi:unnamed protein product, partial [Arabidopsis halleri]